MKNLKSIIVTTIVLTLICAIATVGLALTNDLTADRIEKLAAETEQKAMSRIIKADSFTKSTVELNGEQTYYTAIANGQKAGYIFIVSTNGYGYFVRDFPVRLFRLVANNVDLRIVVERSFST